MRSVAEECRLAFAYAESASNATGQEYLPAPITTRSSISSLTSVSAQVMIVLRSCRYRFETMPNMLL